MLERPGTLLALFRLRYWNGISALKPVQRSLWRTHGRDARSLIDRMRSYVPLEQVFVLLEHTGHYHRALVEYLQEHAISVYVMPGLQASGRHAQIR
jgi:transposase